MAFSNELHCNTKAMFAALVIQCNRLIRTCSVYEIRREGVKLYTVNKPILEWLFKLVQSPMTSLEILVASSQFLGA